MTAINALVSRERVILVTDTALYDRQGIVKGFASKTICLPHLHMAIAMRGPYAALGLAANLIGVAFNHFEDFVSGAADFLAQFHDDHFGLFAESGETEFDLVTIGWSSRSQAPAAYAISSFDHSGVPTGARPFTIKRHSGIYAPTPTRAMLATARINLATVTPAQHEETLIKIIDVQRSQKWPIGSGAEIEGYTVGGGITVTTITRDGISQRQLRTWNDQVGVPLNPNSSATIERVEVVPFPKRQIGGLFLG